MGLLSNRRERKMRAQVDQMNEGADVLAEFSVRVGTGSGAVEAMFGDALSEHERVAVAAYAMTGFVAKQAFNVGPPNGAWLAANVGHYIGRPMEDVPLVDHVPDPIAVYNATVLRQPGNTPYLQTPAEGTDQALASNVDAAIALLGFYMCRNNEDRRAAVRAGAALLTDYYEQGYYDPDRPEHQAIVPWAIMADLAEAELVAPVLGFKEAADAV
jgi:hypothetical protein